MAGLAVGDVKRVNEVQTTCLQMLYNGSKALSHAQYTMAAVQVYHRRLAGQLRGA